MKWKSNINFRWWVVPSAALGAVIWLPIGLIVLGYDGLAPVAFAGIVGFGLGVSIGTYLTCRLIDWAVKEGRIVIIHSGDDNFPAG